MRLPSAPDPDRHVATTGIRFLSSGKMPALQPDLSRPHPRARAPAGELAFSTSQSARDRIASLSQGVFPRCFVALSISSPVKPCPGTSCIRWNFSVRRYPGPSRSNYLPSPHVTGRLAVRNHEYPPWAPASGMAPRIIPEKDTGARGRTRTGKGLPPRDFLTSYSFRCCAT